MQYMSLTFTLLLRDVHILSEKKQGAENFVYYTIFYLKGKIGLYLLIFKNSGKENKNF